jgi:hypothetical protein
MRTVHNFVWKKVSGESEKEYEEDDHSLHF